MESNKVDHYFAKLDSARLYYNSLSKRDFGDGERAVGLFPEYSPEQEREIKDSIKTIIDNNLDYLLTDSFIDYLGDCHDPALYLNNIFGTKYNRMNITTCYLYGVINSIKRIDKGEACNLKYIDLLDEVTRKEATFINDFIENNGGRANDELHTVLMNIFSYCYINGMLDKLETLCNRYLPDHTRFIDDSTINGILFGSDHWYERLITFINDYLNENRRDVL